MLRKLISRTALAVALAGFLAMGTSAAEAKTHVYLWLGMPGFPYWDGARATMEMPIEIA
jgi:hypothetical protein